MFTVWANGGRPTPNGRPSSPDRRVYAAAADLGGPGPRAFSGATRDGDVYKSVTSGYPRAMSDDRPAQAVLDPDGKSGPHSPVDLPPGSASRGWRHYLRAIGPGLVTGASDDDPSGVATYSQAGAATGFGMLWTSLLTFPLMTAVQEICDRTALATGKGLGEPVTTQWRSRTARTLTGVLLVALIGANALNIAADLVAVGSGMDPAARRPHLAVGTHRRGGRHRAGDARLVRPHRQRVQTAVPDPAGLLRRRRNRPPPPPDRCYAACSYPTSSSTPAT
jgi:hypothetical protein